MAAKERSSEATLAALRAKYEVLLAAGLWPLAVGYWLIGK
jgi:hypothetical protein